MYKLVIIDDENETRKALCDYFPWEEHGFEVTAQFETGARALEFIYHHPVDVVLTDIRMPALSGLEVARELAMIKPDIAVLLLSAHTEFEYAREALEYGVKNFIVKPAKYKELVSVFTKLKQELEMMPIGEPMQALAGQTRNVSDKQYNYEETIIDIVKNYVNEHYKDVQLSDLAKLVHLNPNYLSQFFKLKTGKNFSNYLTEVRMQKAEELLRDIKYKIYNISEEVGYTNPQNFTRTFKTFYGISPNDYRRGCKGTVE